MFLDLPNLSLLTEIYIWVELRASKAVKHVKTLNFQDRMSSLIQKKTSERDREYIYLFLPLGNNKYVIIKLLCGEKWAVTEQNERFKEVYIKDKLELFRLPSCCFCEAWRPPIVFSPREDAVS